MEEKEKKNPDPKKKETPKETTVKEATKTTTKTTDKKAAEPVKQTAPKKEEQEKKVEAKKEEPKKTQKTTKKVEKSDKKTVTIVAVVALVLIVCLVIGLIFVYMNRKETKVLTLTDTASVTILYPADKGFEYKEEADPKTAIITKENGDFLIKVQIDTNSLDYWYSGDFAKYKDGKQGKDITINGVAGFSYYYKDAQRYTVVLPVDEKTTISIDIEPADRNENNPTGEEIFNREDVRQIIDAIKVENL